MENIPILQIKDLLLVSIQDPHDEMASRLQQDLAQKIDLTGARGVLIDVSTMKAVDEHLGRFLDKLVSLVRIMKAEAAIVGMRPAVALTMVEMNVTLPGVLTAVDMDSATELLESRMRNKVKKPSAS